MRDPRLDKLADVLVNYSCRVKKGEKILIEAKNADYAIVSAIVEKVYKAGGFPFVQVYENRITRALNLGMTEELAKLMAEFDGYKMKNMDAYIGIRGGNNAFELSDVPAEKMHSFDKFYNHTVHHEIRVKKTKWVVLRFPNEGMAALAKKSTDAFENFYFDVCTLDYAKMDKAMDPFCELINKTDRVRIIAKDTDISFSIKGIGSEKCSGLRNIPDGEVYTAPIRNSVNGVITYNTPSVENGIEFKNVRFEFVNGKIVKASANNTEALNKILDTDEGARYIGEFAFGVNPFILAPMCDILFDEKIAGSIHFTPGSCYDECDNGNQSAIHWDLVQIQTPEYGGGEIYFDDVLIRKDGRFVLQTLLGLNPENLS